MNINTVTPVQLKQVGEAETDLGFAQSASAEETNGHGFYNPADISAKISLFLTPALAHLTSAVISPTGLEKIWSLNIYKNMN